MASGNIKGLVRQPYMTFKTKCGKTIEVWKDHTKWLDLRCGDKQMDLKYLPLSDQGLSDALFTFCDHFDLCLVDQNYTSKCVERVTGLTIKTEY